MLALATPGLGALPSELVTSAGKHAVVLPTSEIALRHILWKAAGAPVLALVEEPLARRLPADLVRRSRGSRVHAIELAEILSLALGVRVVTDDDGDMQRLALMQVDHIQRELRQRTLPTVVDRDLLDDLLLDTVAGGGLRRSKPGEVLARWLEGPPVIEAAVAALLQRQLPRVHGLVGRVLAWAVREKKLPEALMVHGILLALDEPELAQVAWGPLWEAPAQVELTQETFRHVVATLVREALTALGDGAATYLLKAETIGRKVLPSAVLRRSTDLPLGLKSQCDDVAKRAARGEPVGHDIIQHMQQHRYAAAQRAEIDVLEELARLSRYLDTPVQADGDVTARVRHYQREGAFADWTAARLRTALAASPAFRREAETVLGRYRERRDQENLAFAELLRAGLTSALHTAGVVPLYQLWQNPPVRADMNDAPRLFLVVLDGCSYPVFLRFLEELAREFKPIGLRGDPEAHGAPALALLPSITSHSRSAIFLGEVPKNPWIAETVWRDTEESRSDPARFRQNKALGGRSRKLFLKGDLTDHGEKLLAELQGEATDVVAAVFNAVDDQIGSSNTGATISVRAREISGLLASLEAALKAGRRVIVTADHGHTPFVSRELRTGDAPKEGSSARHRLLREGEAPPSGFVEIADEGLGGVEGRKAFAWKMGVYQGSPQVGFHGGCSLEEMVVPLAELVAGGVAADEPSWWIGGRALVPAAPVQPEPTKRPVTARPPKMPAQVGLFEREAVLASVVDRLDLPAPLLALLDASERAALTCVAQNKHVRMSDLSASLQRPQTRVPGLMSRLITKLHAGGFPCIRREPLPSGEDQYVYVPQGRDRGERG
ncbi:MAG: BREX-2 system phosphatase PglZ [Byssovorax sp.]